MNFTLLNRISFPFLCISLLFNSQFWCDPNSKLQRILHFFSNFYWESRYIYFIVQFRILAQESTPPNNIWGEICPYSMRTGTSPSSDYKYRLNILRVEPINMHNTILPRYVCLLRFGK